LQHGHQTELLCLQTLEVALGQDLQLDIDKQTGQSAWAQAEELQCQSARVLHDLAQSSLHPASLVPSIDRWEWKRAGAGPSMCHQTCKHVARRASMLLAGGRPGPSMCHQTCKHVARRMHATCLHRGLL